MLQPDGQQALVRAGRDATGSRAGIQLGAGGRALGGAAAQPSGGARRHALPGALAGPHGSGRRVAAAGGAGALPGESGGLRWSTTPRATPLRRPPGQVRRRARACSSCSPAHAATTGGTHLIFAHGPVRGRDQPGPHEPAGAFLLADRRLGCSGFGGLWRGVVVP